MYAKANDIVPLLRELTRLGACDVRLDADNVPTLDALDPEGACATWTVDLAGDCPREAVLEVFEFVDGDCDLEIEPLVAEVEAELPPIDVESLLAEARQPQPRVPDGEVQALIDQIVPVVALAPEAPRAAAAPAAQTAAAAANDGGGRAAATAATTIRVDLDKVDRLVNLVGELVITQAMLAQRVDECAALANVPRRRRPRRSRTAHRARCRKA